MGDRRAAVIAAAFTAACRAELKALKPGNVHCFAPARKSIAMFRRSAAAAAPALAQGGASIGARILDAVRASRAAVGTNTNLGIILLCAPLAAAGERGHADLQEALRLVLAGLDHNDAVLAFQAIAEAAPGGLGRVAQHDVFLPPRVSLREAMASAAERDRIARQYVTDFADVFRLGQPLLVAARQRFAEPSWATVALYLGFLSRFADTHVVREHGAAVAEEVLRQAEVFAGELARRAEPASLLPELLAWDCALKRRSINPGTSADLTVATLFAARLNEHLAVGGQQ